MPVKLKPIAEQVMLITGASSGIGLLTAQTAASMGAKVVLVARNEPALKEAVQEIESKGGEAVYAVADVADVAQFRAAAEAGVAKFGRIDTWVNNAGVGMFGKVEEIDLADDKRLFETNFWGVVNGSRLAVEYLRGSGGALINVGSEVSDAAVPIQAMYSASKHAVKGFTDGLRMEVLNAGLPISVTLVKPAAIDTPFAKHARNYMDVEPTLPAPVYAPHLVASAILFVAEHPRRDIFVGGGGRAISSLANAFPNFMDWVGSKMFVSQQQSDRPAEHREGSLHETQQAGEVRGGIDRDRMIRNVSAYNTTVQHPMISAAVVTGLAAAVAAYFILKPEPETTTQRLARTGRETARDGYDRLQETLERTIGRSVEQGQAAWSQLSKRAQSLWN